MPGHPLTAGEGTERGRGETERLEGRGGRMGCSTHSPLLRAGDAEMRWLYVRWQRCWEAIVHQVKGIMPGIVVSWWLLPGLMVLGLLALGASAVSQHRMLHPTPSSQSLQGPIASHPSLPTLSPHVAAGKAYLGIRGKRLSRVRCGSQSTGRIPRFPSGASRPALRS